jgi:ribosomal protein S3
LGIFLESCKKKTCCFCIFFKKLFKSIIKISNSNESLDNSCIKGIKFILSGKIRGKLRGSIICIQEGRVPVQNISKNVDFNRLDAFSLIGTFGMKL